MTNVTVVNEVKIPFHHAV